MKKLFTSIFACALAAGVALSLAGCDFGKDSDGENTDGTNTETNTGTNTGTNSSDKGERLSSDASWGTAFNEELFRNCRMDGTVTGKRMVMDGVQITTGSYVVVHVEDLEYVKLESNGEELPAKAEYFYEEGDKNEDGIFDYSKDESGKWVAFDEEAIPRFLFLIEKFSKFQYHADEFTFDEEDGAYVYEKKEEDKFGYGNKNYDICRLKYKNDNIVKVMVYSYSSHVMNEKTWEAEYTWEFTITYGGQSLTAPVVSEE